jgi:hypothetical protein
LETTTTTSSTTTTTIAPLGYDCPDRTYNPVNSNCGLSAFSFTEQSGSLQVVNFGANGTVPFTIQSASSATAGSLIIFSQPNHTCALECLDASTGSLRVSCTNPLGGSCNQLLQ